MQNLHFYTCEYVHIILKCVCEYVHAQSAFHVPHVRPYRHSTGFACVPREIHSAYHKI